MPNMMDGTWMFSKQDKLDEHMFKRMIFKQTSPAVVASGNFAKVVSTAESRDTPSCLGTASERLWEA